MAVLAINDGDGPDEIRSFLRGIPHEFPILRQKGEEITQAYHVSGLPIYYVIGRDGRILAHLDCVQSDEMRAALGKLRARPIRPSDVAGTWFCRAPDQVAGGAIDIRDGGGHLEAFGKCRTDIEKDWFQVGIVSGSTIRWLARSQYGQWMESETWIEREGVLSELRWHMPGGRRVYWEWVRTPAGKEPESSMEIARRSGKSVHAMTVDTIFTSGADARAWIENVLRRLRKNPE